MIRAVVCGPGPQVTQYCTLWVSHQSEDAAFTGSIRREKIKTCPNSMCITSCLLRCLHLAGLFEDSIVSSTAHDIPQSCAFGSVVAGKNKNAVLKE